MRERARRSRARANAAAGPRHVRTDRRSRFRRTPTRDDWGRGQSRRPVFTRPGPPGFDSCSASNGAGSCGNNPALDRVLRWAHTLAAPRSHLTRHTRSSSFHGRSFGRELGSSPSICSRPRLGCRTSGRRARRRHGVQQRPVCHGAASAVTPNVVSATPSLLFSPPEITIVAGDSVTWAFGGIPHKVVFQRGRDSGSDKGIGKTGDDAPPDIATTTNASVTRVFRRERDVQVRVHAAPGHER